MGILHYDFTQKIWRHEEAVIFWLLQRSLQVVICVSQSELSSMVDIDAREVESSGNDWHNSTKTAEKNTWTKRAVCFRNLIAVWWWVFNQDFFITCRLYFVHNGYGIFHIASRFLELLALYVFILSELFWWPKSNMDYQTV